jgi:uncharacterized membrane protein SirB2
MWITSTPSTLAISSTLFTPSGVSIMHTTRVASFSADTVWLAGVAR